MRQGCSSPLAIYFNLLDLYEPQTRSEISPEKSPLQINQAHRHGSSVSEISRFEWVCGTQSQINLEHKHKHHHHPPLPHLLYHSPSTSFYVISTLVWRRLRNLDTEAPPPTLLPGLSPRAYTLLFQPDKQLYRRSYLCSFTHNHGHPHICPR